jgi:hypothetical protein
VIGGLRRSVEEPRSGRPSRPVLGAIVAALLAAAIILAVAVALRGQSKDIVVGLGAALASALVTIVLAVLGYQERQQEAINRTEAAVREEGERARIRHEQRAFGALEYFTGRTQRRNVGIAIIEGSWRDVPEMRRMFIPLLANQASYLLEKSDEHGAVHEVDNCRRIIGLLIAWEPEFSAGPESVYYQQLRTVIRRRLASPTRTGVDGSGVDVDPGELRAWLAELGPAGPGSADAGDAGR